MYSRSKSRLWICIAAAGLVAAPALAGDFGVSFHYGSSYPSCGTAYRTYYAPAYPVDYVYYGDPYAYVDYYPARAVVYDSYYPTTYRTTYTRSRYYAYPRNHSGVSARYRSDHGRHYYSSPSRHSVHRSYSHSRSGGRHWRR